MTCPVASSIGLSRTPTGVVCSVPEQGEHTADILSEIGYSGDEIARLRDGKIV